MKVLILAAGYATRLYPLTENQPKPLLEVQGKKIIEYIIDSICTIRKTSAAIDTVYIVTNNKFYNHFVEWKRVFIKENPKLKFKIDILNDLTMSNDDRLGALGDMNFVIKKRNVRDDLLVIGGDNLFKLDLDEFIRFFNTKKSSILAVYDIIDPKKAANKYGVLVLDKEKKITQFVEKPSNPPASTISTAIYLFKTHDLDVLNDYLARGQKTDNLGDYIAYMVNNHPVYGFPFSNGWVDIGSKDELEWANKEWEQ